jgi:hypothetical protein
MLNTAMCNEYAELRLFPLTPALQIVVIPGVQKGNNLHILLGKH